MIRIKDDILMDEEISLIAFVEAEKQVILHFRNGAIVVYGPEYRSGQIPRQRVITAAEYGKIKDYFTIEKKAQVVA